MRGFIPTCTLVNSVDAHWQMFPFQVATALRAIPQCFAFFCAFCSRFSMALAIDWNDGFEAGADPFLPTIFEMKFLKVKPERLLPPWDADRTPLISACRIFELTLEPVPGTYTADVLLVNLEGIDALIGELISALIFPPFVDARAATGFAATAGFEQGSCTPQG